MKQFVTAFLALILMGCSQGDRSELTRWMAPGDKPRVLSTTEIVGDVVAHVGGDAICHLVLIQGTLDPHSYTLVKGDMEKFIRADVVFSNGLGLEHGASLRAQLEGCGKVHPLGDAIDRKALIVRDGTIDPHVWMDPVLWCQTIDGVSDRLSKLIPEEKEGFAARAQALKERYLAVDREVELGFETIAQQKRYFVTSHDAFHYFARRYLGGDRFAAPEGLSPDGQLSSHDIERITQFIREHGICVVFPESNVSLDSLKKVVDSSQRSGDKVELSGEELYGDALGEKGSAQETYVGMMRHNGRVIAEGMRCAK